MSIVGRVISKVAGGSRRTRDGSADAAGQNLDNLLDTPGARELYDQVAAVPFWFHSIDLGHGITTPGHKSPETHRMELARFRLPDLRGKSVLDIGAWDGFYSFTAERLGAARVVALDKHVWSLDWEAKRRYKAECKEKSIPPQPYNLVPELWRTEELPGKRGFDLAHEALQSQVEASVNDFMKMDLELLGQFDVVFYLGVLYHMENPLEGLRRLRCVTKEVAVIETEAIAIRGFESTPLCEFFPLHAKLAGDPTNFWAPNAPALVGLCETAGFRKVEILGDPPAPTREKITRHRLVAHVFV